MEYGSFYGGRRGASFVIVKSYRTIKEPAENNEGYNKIIRIDMDLPIDAEITSTIRNQWLEEHCMVYNFQNGDDYKTVGYNEYVIIDSYNKNDLDNGKIYRRGMDLGNGLGGAIYIGQIVGPAGMAPHTLLENYDLIENMVDEDGLLIPADGDISIDKNLNQYRKTKQSLEVKDEANPTSGDLLPGQYFDENGVAQYNDTIDYVACSIRDFDSHESTVHIGFKIPYLVHQYTAESVSPYYHRNDMEPTNLQGDDKWAKWDADTVGVTGGDLNSKEKVNFQNRELVKRMDDLSHPFYSEWDIKVPQGIKGDTFKRFRVTTVEEELRRQSGDKYEEDNIMSILQNYEDYTNDNTSNSTEEQRKNHKRKILVYDYYHYDRVQGGDPVTYYLGDYNQIDDIQLDEDGTFRIFYSHDDADIYPNVFKWIDEVDLNVNNGYFEVFFNYDQEYLRNTNGDFIDENGNIVDEAHKVPIEDTETHYGIYMDWIKDVKIDENGTIHFIHTHNNATKEDNFDQTFDQLITIVKEISIDSVTGEVVVTYNNDKVDEDGNVITDSDGNPVKVTYETQLRWLNNLNIAQDGTITLKYTTTKTDEDGNIIDDVILTKKLNWPDKLSIHTEDTNHPYYDASNPATAEGTGDQKVWVKNNNPQLPDYPIGEPLNYIMETAKPTEGDYAWHLLVLYSDPVKRAEIQTKKENAVYTDRNGVLRNDWHDLGYIGMGQVGALVSKEKDTSALEIAKQLPPYSAWFIIDEPSVQVSYTAD